MLHTVFNTINKRIMKLVKVNESSIKGYHNFKIRPHPEIEMVVERDVTNIYDPHAMIIKMPELKKIPSSFYKAITKSARGKEKAQTVEEIAGETVGRVPANVCKLFNKLLQEGDIKEITC